MKKLVLLLFVSSLTFGQGLGVEIHFVDSTVGYSNDAGLNQILQQYGTFFNEMKGGHPVVDPVVQLYCNSSDLDQFVADLQAYSSVVSYAHITHDDFFSDFLLTNIVDLNVGISTDLITNSGVTNDPVLNQIFQDFNVYYYAKSFPDSTWEINLKAYDIVCNCNIIDLKAALDNYSAVISSTDFVGGAYLNKTKFETKPYKVTPNPFATTFTIQTKETILNYSIFDISGKQMINTQTKSDLDYQVQNLESGMYFLKLQTNNGFIFNQKLLKK